MPFPSFPEPPNAHISLGLCTDSVGHSHPSPGSVQRSLSRDPCFLEPSCPSLAGCFILQTRAHSPNYKWPKLQPSSCSGNHCFHLWPIAARWTEWLWSSWTQCMAWLHLKLSKLWLSICIKGTYSFLLMIFSVILTLSPSAASSYTLRFLICSASRLLGWSLFNASSHLRRTIVYRIKYKY